MPTPAMSNVRERLRDARRALRERQRSGSARRNAIRTLMFALSAMTVAVLYSASSRPGAAPKVRTVTVEARRGTIRDRTGNLLAQTVALSRVMLVPKELARRFAGHREALIAGLAEVLTLDLTEVRQALDSGRKRVRLKQKVLPSEAKALRALRIGPDKRGRAVVGAGIEIEADHERYYPNGTAAAHLLGFVNHEGAGVEGIERSFDRSLRGATAKVPSMIDARGHVVFSDVPLDSRTAEGVELTLTIDLRIQEAAEDALALGVQRVGGRAGQVVVMDPHTGEILALANHPTFDPNLRGDDAEARRNRAVTEAYEPGSVMKLFTVAGALAAGVVDESESIDCGQGVVWIGRTPISDTHPHGLLTLGGILAKSSNIGALKLGARLGRERLHRTLVDFGFGATTGLPLSLESEGIVKPAKHWTPLDAASISFGQGVGVTGIQLAAAVSAIANGGRYMQPRLVRRIRSALGEVTFEATPNALRRVISKDVARRLTHLMRGVTASGGTGEGVHIEGYTVAGKTGTAQKSSPGRGYADGAYVASFVGFLPAEAPALVISVAIDEPRGTHLGSAVAGPVFQQVASESLLMLGVPGAPGTYATGLVGTPVSPACHFDAGASTP
jgi:cell division protein FtsI (penicillin-binding protein 3)